MSASGAAAEKRALRGRLRAAWRALSEAEREQAAEGAAAAVQQWDGWRRAATVAVFLHLPDELPTTPLIRASVAAGKRVAAPVSLPGGELRFHAFDPDALRAGRFGIAEPDPERSPAIPADALDLVVVPGLAFDAEGFRLGRGGGYYDRLLARLPSGTLTVGWTLPAFVVDRLPREPHDLPVGFLATPDGVRPARRADAPRIR